MKTKFICFLVLFISINVNAQNLHKILTQNQFNTHINFDKIKKGDTLSLIIKEKGEYFFGRNHNLKEFNIYGYCGNKNFIDYITPKPPKYSTIGKWKIENQSILALLLDKKKYIFTYLYSENNVLFFILN